MFYVHYKSLILLHFSDSTHSSSTINTEHKRDHDLTTMDPTSQDRNVDDCVFKEDFNYEGRVRIEKHKDELEASYQSYVAQHPEINAVLHDVMLHILSHKPDRPLEEISAYVRSRKGV